MARVYLEANLVVAAPALELDHMKRRCGIRADLHAKLGLRMNTGGAAAAVPPGVVTVVVIRPEEARDGEAVRGTE